MRKKAKAARPRKARAKVANAKPAPKPAPGPVDDGKGRTQTGGFLAGHRFWRTPRIVRAQPSSRTATPCGPPATPTSAGPRTTRSLRSSSSPSGRDEVGARPKVAADDQEGSLPVPRGRPHDLGRVETGPSRAGRSDRARRVGRSGTRSSPAPPSASSTATWSPASSGSPTGWPAMTAAPSRCRT